MRSHLTALLALGALLLSGGCRGGAGSSGGWAAANGGGSGDGASAPFAGSEPTLDALGRTVLHGLAAGDTAALERVRLTEVEHNEAVWPELPAANAAANFPVDLAWENVQTRNRRDRSRLLGWFEGRTLRLSRVECRGPVERLESFHVLTDCWVVFDDGELGRLASQLFEDVVVRGGGHKIVRYDADRAPTVARRGVQGVSSFLDGNRPHPRAETGWTTESSSTTGTPPGRGSGRPWAPSNWTTRP